MRVAVVVILVSLVGALGVVQAQASTEPSALLRPATTASVQKAARWGLIAVDFPTQERTLKRSATFFADVISANAVAPA